MAKLRPSPSIPLQVGSIPHQRKKMSIMRAACLLLLSLCTIGVGQASAQSYCTPYYYNASDACSYGIVINDFSITGEAGTSISDISSGCDGSGFQDRTFFSPVTLIPGNTYLASINVSAYEQNVQAWIDFNDNGTFESTETVGGLTDVTYSNYFTIAVPVGANGGTHRMRLVSNYYYDDPGYPDMDACGIFYYGETQDYLVQVGAPVTVTPVPAMCAGSSATLTASGATTYSWAPTAGLNTTTGASVVATPSATTTYTVTGVQGSYTSTATVTVTVHSDITPIAGSTTLNASMPAQLTNEMTGGTWSSANPSVAIVSSTGLVTAASAGNTTISYTLAGCPSVATTNVTVTNVNAALNFDGANDYVTTGNTLPANSSYTKEAWVYANVIGSNNIISSNSSPFWIHFGYLAAANSWETGGSLVSDPSPFPANQWVHVAVTYDAPTTTLKLYKNGVLVASRTDALSYTAGADEIGAYNASNFFNGKIDEVRIWNVARTQAQIQANMNCDVPQQSGLVAYYRFDQGTASGTNTGMTSAFDYSGNNHCATLNNFTLSGSSSNYVTGAVGSCNPITLVQPIVGNAPVCAGTTLSLSSASSGGSWSTSDASIATVDATTGVVTAVAAGNATIDYTKCSSGTSTVVTVNPVPAAISGAAAVCTGSTTTFTNAVGGGSWATADGKAAIDISGAVTGIASGATTVIYTLPAGCFTTKAVTVNQTPADITGTTVICVGNTTSLSSATTGDVWSSSDPSIASIDAASGIVNTGNAGNITISYTSPAGCVKTASLTVNALPATVGGPSAVCMSSSVTLTNSTTGGQWSTADAGTATIDAATGVVTPVAVGNTTISYTLPSGCYATSALVVNPLPATITGTTNMCAGNTTSLTSATTGGAWSSANNAIVTVSTEGIVSSGAAAGNSTITYTIPATGCYVTSSVNNMVAAITGSQGICSGLTATVADATTGGTWSSSSTTLAAIGTGGVITAGAGGGAATISYTSGGCYRTSPFTVSTTPGAITGTTLVCVGANTTLYNASPGGAWSPAPTGAASITAGGVVTGVAAGTTVISYRLSATCYATTLFSVSPLPYAISSTARACPGTNVTLSDGTPGGTWSISDPTLASVSLSGVVTGLATGTPVVTYTAGGCFRTIAVTINPNPPAITGGTLINAGSTSVLSEAATNGTGWSSSNTAVATVAGGTSGTVSGVSVGTAIITFMTNTGCYATKQVTVATLSAISGTTKACIGAPTTYSCASPGGVWSVSNPSIATIDPALGILTATSQGAVTVSYTQGPLFKTLAVAVYLPPTAITGSQLMCVGTSSYIVSNGSSGTWISSNPAVASFPNTTGTINGMSIGTANVTFTAQVSGCTVAAVVTVNPAITAITGTTNACVGASTILANSQAAGTWSSANPAIASVDAATGVVTAIGAGTTTITYAISPNCTVTATYTSKALPNAIAGTSSVCMPVTATLTSATTGGTWSSSDATIAAVGSAINTTYGVVTGASSGAAMITYTIPGTGCYRTSVVTVNAGLNPGTISASNGFSLRTVSVPHLTTLTSNGAAGGVWSSSNPAIASVDPVSGVVNGVATGSATITYSVTGACTNTATHAITVAAGRDGNAAPVENVSVDLYPNPTTGAFTVTASQSGTLRIFTLDGKELASHNVTAGATTLSMPSGVASGIYMCRFTAEDGSNVVFRLVLEN